MPTVKNGLIGLGIILSWVVGVALGRWTAPTNTKVQATPPVQPSFSRVELERRDGDEISFRLTGPVRLSWADGERFRENSDQELLGKLSYLQIPTDDEVLDPQFPYWANLKTKKFYAADSYSAGCLTPFNRRGFVTRQAAESAGFIPSKALD